MELFFVVLACFIVAATFRRKGALYNFDSKATVPLRGLLAIGIILHHLSRSYCFNECIGAVHVSPVYYFSNMGAPIVAAFFFITGFGLAKSLQTKGSSYLSGFMKKRLGKVLPEFIILTVLALVAADTCGIVSYSEAIAKMATGDVPLPYSWFIYAIVYVYFAFYVSAVVAHADCRLTGVAFTLMIVLYCGIIMALRWGGWWVLSVPAIPLGYYVALYEEKINLLLSRHYVIAAIGIGTLTYAFIYNFIPGGRLMGVTLFALALYVCMRLYCIRPWPVLVLLGELSLYIYLVHGAVLQVIRKGFDFDKYLAVAIVILASVAVSVLIKRIRGFVENRHFRVYSKNRA